MLKSEETVSCWFRNYGQYSSLGCVQSVVQHIPYFFSQPGKAVIFLPGFSFPPETAGRQEVTKERSSGPLGLGPRSPPDSRNSRSGAEPSRAERSRAARRPPHLRSRRELARSLARPPARATASPPRPGQPAPPLPVRSRSRSRGSGLRCRRHDWNVGRPVGRGPSCMSPGADCTGHAAGGGQIPWLEVMV